MNKILFTTALAASMALSAHAQYKITAHLDSIPEGVAYLQIRGENVDSATVKDGNFVIVGKKLITAKRKACGIKNEMRFSDGKTKCAIKKHPSNETWMLFC